MQTDAWQDGDLYEPYVGRWSRAVASHVRRLARGTGRRSRWLDVGCGTGALSETILLRAEPSEVRGVDQSEGFVKYAGPAPGRPAVRGAGRRRSRPAVRGRVVRCRRLRADAELHRGPRRRGEGARARRGFRRHRRRLRLGLRRRHADDALLLGRGEGPGSRGPRAGRGGSVRGDRLAEGSRRPVRCGGTGRRALTVDRHPDDLPRLRRLLVRRSCAGQGPAPAYCASLEDGKRAELRELLRVRLPTKADGTIRLTARAWAVQGVRP